MEPPIPPPPPSMQPPPTPQQPFFAGNTPGQNGGDDLGTGLKIVSFCFPIVGAILYFVKKDKEPVAAKQACTFALIGFGLGIVFNVIYVIFNTLLRH